MKEGLVKAGPTLLEPIMLVEVITPDEYVGDVIGDLSKRRGRITGQDQRNKAGVISAMVPPANMFGYDGSLRSISRCQAQYTMRFDHYRPVPHRTPDPDFPGAVGMRA
jgi:elongation factor G